MSFLFDALTREECEAIREEDGYERGRREGIDEGELRGESRGRRQGIYILIEDNLEEGKTEEQIFEKLQKKYGLSEEECKKYLKECHVNEKSNK